MSKKICKSNPAWEDVAHFCIIKFTEHERAQELVDTGMAMKFLSGMMYRSYWSQTSQYYKEYCEKGRMVYNGWSKPENAYIDDIQDTPYDQSKDDAIEAILGIIEDMKHTDGEGGNRDKKLWEIATYLEQWAHAPNFSELSRKTGVPRTTMSQGVREAIGYIKQVLKNNNIDYDPT